MTLKDGLICLLDGRTGNNNDTIWKDLSGNGNDFVLQNWTFNNDNKWTGHSIKKSRNGGVIQFKDGNLSNVRSIIMKVKIQDFSEPSYLIDLRPGAPNGWIYSTAIGSSFVRRLKCTKDGLVEFDNNPNKMVSDKFVCYYMELDNNTDCNVFLGSRYSLNEKFSGEIKNVYIYNRPLSDEEIMKLCKDGLLLLKEYVNNNNLPTIVDKLMDASNIKIANNKYGNRVQTVIDKIVEKADNVTKAINQEVINTDYSFKVGTGTNVDVSSDVQDGFGKIDLKGKTYQNLNKIRNVNYNSKGDINIPIKPNTTYTIVCDLIGNTTNTPVVCALFSSVKASETENYNGDSLYSATVSEDKGTETKTNTPLGHNVYTYTTKSNEVWCHFRGGNQSTPNTDTKNIMLLEGDYTNDPNLPSYFEGIVGVGDKSKNLFNKNDLELGAISEQEGSTFDHLEIRRTKNYIKVIPNEYLYITANDNIRIFEYDINKNYIGSTVIMNNALKLSSNTSLIKIHFGIYVIPEVLQVEIGSVATPYEPYYEGHKIEILSNGKNLIDVYNDNIKTALNSSHKITLNNSNGFDLVSLTDNTGWIYSQIKFPITLKPNTRYRLSCIIEKSNPTSKPYIRLYDFDKEQSFGDLERTGSANFVTGTTNLDNYRLLLYSSIDDIPSKQNDKVSFKNICLEELGDFIYPYSYEPYKKNKTQILLDEPLMRLPNGVCDEITKDGKLIRRVGKIVEDGSGEWTHYTTAPASSENMLFSCERGLSVATNSMESLLCNNFSVSNSWSDSTREGVRMGRPKLSGLDIRINKSKLQTPDISGFKQWLSQNPTTVYYELVEPVITDIILPSVRIYKDGHLTFNTLVAPESTHYVQLNKSAQINNTLEQVQSLNKKVDALDIIYNSLISSTSNTLSNLNK